MCGIPGDIFGGIISGIVGLIITGTKSTICWSVDAICGPIIGGGGGGLCGTVVGGSCGTALSFCQDFVGAIPGAIGTIIQSFTVK